MTDTRHNQHADRQTAPTQLGTAYFIYRDGPESYALPPESVVEVVSKIKVTPVPFTQEWIEGVIYVRGKVVPVVDLRRYFQLPRVELQERRRMLLLGVRGNQFAVWAEEISGIEAVAKDAIEAPLATLPAALLGCSTAQFRLKDRLVYVLDLPKLLIESRGRVERR